jgi:hypothetical protein
MIVLQVGNYKEQEVAMALVIEITIQEGQAKTIKMTQQLKIEEETTLKNHNIKILTRLSRM